MSAYREGANVVPFFESVKEHAGPRPKCPTCGESYITYQFSAFVSRSAGPVSADVRACSGRNWLLRLFGGCSRLSPHLHQWCRACGSEWTCGPKETK